MRKKKKEKIKRVETNTQHDWFFQNGSGTGWGKERIEFNLWHSAKRTLPVGYKNAPNAGKRPCAGKQSCFYC